MNCGNLQTKGLDREQRICVDRTNLGEVLIVVHQLNSYRISKKEAFYERDQSVAEILQQIKDDFQVAGLRRTVEGVLIVHKHSVPHVLLLRQGVHFFKLPGGKLNPGEEAREGLRRHLQAYLGLPNEPIKNWKIGELLCNWWRPNFDLILYPYIPAHVTKPKEKRQIFVVNIPEKESFSIPRNYSLAAIPLFEMYGDPQIYGPVIASLPVVLSRLKIIYR